MLCVTWTDSQNSTNVLEVNCDPWSECRINSPFRTGCDSNAFFRVRIARSLVICRSGYTGDNTSIMQIYDCTVVAYFMVFQKQIGKIGTPFLTVLSLCGHNDLPSGVFGIFMLFIKTIKLEKHCFPNLIICLLSTQEENSILAGRITWG